MEEFYTTEQISKNLKVTKMTIYRYIKAGKIKAYKFWKEIRVRKEDYESFILNNRFIVN